jgi:hypothetical protein
VFTTLLLSGLVACGDPNTLPPVQFDNVVDTTSLYALTGTPIGSPSGFDGVLGEVRRTDVNRPFDFAVDIAPDGTVLLYPAGALGLASQPGLQLVSETFDGITTAPLEDYDAESAQAVAPGGVFVLRSRNSSELCTVNTQLPRYGKFRLLEVDPQQRSVTFEFLVNRNCGYRDLVPGTPEA